MTQHEIRQEMSMLNRMMRELERIDWDEQDRLRTDHCPYCGAWWEDPHYEECQMVKPHAQRL